MLFRLFSTKFLEDLDYKAQAKRMPPQRDLETIDFIQTIKQDVNKLIPSRSYDEEPILNKLAIELAQSIMNKELEAMVRQLISTSLNEELSKATAFEQPVYAQIYEIAAVDLVRRIAGDVLDEEKSKVAAIEANEITKVAKENLVTNLMLDHMLDKMAQHGRASAENEDISKLLDGINLLFLQVFNSITIYIYI